MPCRWKLFFPYGHHSLVSVEPNISRINEIAIEWIQFHKGLNSNFYSTFALVMLIKSKKYSKKKKKKSGEFDN